MSGTAINHGRIMVVEDHTGIRESLIGLLQDEGYDAVGAKSGTEALMHLQLERPSLILLDLMMPGMNGVDLSSRLAEDPWLAAIPVVVVTASRKTMGETGIRAVGWLQKPFDIAELLALIEKHAAPPGAQHASGEARSH